MHTVLMDNADLFQKYLEICNQALDANKERFPFKQILGAAQKQASTRKVEVSIIDDTPQSSYLIHIEHGKIAGEPQEECGAVCGSCRCSRQWRITRSYLENVVKNPQAYIDNPAKIDWEWMYNSESS